jgi:hypothetical protein
VRERLVVGIEERHVEVAHTRAAERDDRDTPHTEVEPQLRFAPFGERTLLDGARLHEPEGRERIVNGDVPWFELAGARRAARDTDGRGAREENEGRAELRQHGVMPAGVSDTDCC